MAAQSDFFEGLFTFEDKLEYKISDVSETTMKIVLDAFYEINISEKLDEEMTKEILATAQYFQAPFLKKKAINIYMSKFFVDSKKTEIFDFARKFQIVDLEKKLARRVLQKIHRIAPF